MAAMVTAHNINTLRPMTSLITLEMSREKAKHKVEIDNTQLLCAALNVNSAANNGIKGCTQYNIEKLANPPNNMARRIFF